ncbi:MAG: hypothetical protein GF398_12060 [Chitinivibrionales bacterium]|nr:hypothetical protein [Chitinivibrionales bacterium]
MQFLIRSLDKARKAMLIGICAAWILAIVMDVMMGLVRGAYTLRMKKPIKLAYNLLKLFRSKSVLALLILNGILLFKAGSKTSAPERY